MRCPQVNRNSIPYITESNALGMGPWAGEWCPYRGWTWDYIEHLPGGKFGEIEPDDEESMVPWAHTDMPSAM